MKRVLIAAISLCIVAATAAPVSAFAAQRSSAPSYPDIYDDPLTFTALSDYAVAGDGKYVFAQDKEILFLKNEDLTSYSFDVKVEAVDCSEGVFYYTRQGDGKVYSLPDQAESQYTMPDFTKEITDDSDPNLQYYYNTGSGTLTLLDKSKDTNEALTELTGCTRIKKYGGTLYVIKENSLCTLNGAAASKVSLTYSNYGELETIPVGDAPEKLNTYSTYGQHCKVVTIGSHDKVTATAIDLNELSDSANGTRRRQHGSSSVRIAKPFDNLHGLAVLYPQPERRSCKRRNRARGSTERHYRHSECGERHLCSAVYERLNEVG